MDIPFFFEETVKIDKEFVLSEESSRHIVQVLRMTEGDTIQITDGKGHLFTANISAAHKKKALVNIIDATFVERKTPPRAVAVSLVKNTSRFEWFVEKATELGITEIFPLICRRTEKTNLKAERIKGIMVSAMLQSKQVWLPEFHLPIAFKDFVVSGHQPYGLKLMAHCENDQERSPIIMVLQNNKDSAVVLIGPEGDFTPEEIGLARNENFVPVSLGENRLRTETAALMAAVILKSI